MSLEDFFQAQILLRSGACFNSLVNVISFPHIMNALTFLWEIVEISIIIWSAFYHFSELETPVSLATDYSKYPRIVAGRTSNWLVYLPFLRLRHQNNMALLPKSRQLRRLRELFLLYVAWNDKSKFPREYHLVWNGKTKLTSYKGLLRYITYIHTYFI